MESTAIFTIVILGIFEFLFKHGWEILIAVWAALLLIALNGIGDRLASIKKSIDDLQDKDKIKNNNGGFKDEVQQK